jgi:hypothetical protein
VPMSPTRKVARVAVGLDPPPTARPRQTASTATAGTPPRRRPRIICFAATQPGTGPPARRRPVRPATTPAKRDAITSSARGGVANPTVAAHARRSPRSPAARAIRSGDRSASSR